MYQLASPQEGIYGDPTIAAMAAARLNEVGNLSIQNAVENAGRLSAMFGVRSAQTNPIEAASISAIERSSQPGNAQNAALSSSLAAMMMNLANKTPQKATP